MIYQPLTVIINYVGNKHYLQSLHIIITVAIFHTLSLDKITKVTSYGTTGAEAYDFI